MLKLIVTFGFIREFGGSFCFLMDKVGKAFLIFVLHGAIRI